MAEDSLSGRLAVILHADVAGSTEMVQKDERLSHERIQDSFRRFSNKVEEYSGKVLELRGDALLAGFERPSDAVSAALAFQSDHSKVLAALADDLRPEIRIGIAMGEVIIADNTITGAGVVLAQRVEQLADPGGLCISAAVRESLSRRLPVALESMGPQALKGFEEAIGVYKVASSSDTIIPPPAPLKPSSRRRISPATIGIAAIAAAAISAAAVFWAGRETVIEKPTPADQLNLEAPENPSIAVLPFSNLNGDSQEDYFSDGITNDIITDLSQVSSLQVIASNSVFVYKSNPVKVQQVAKDLGVTHVLEGSVQKAGDKVRINAQLIDANSGHHLWAERYDREIVDIFELQDDVSRTIVDILAVRLTNNERRQLDRHRQADPQAYDMLLRGLEELRRFTRETNDDARQYFMRAIEFDPQFARAYADVAFSHAMDILFGWEEASRQKFETAFEYADKAVELDDSIGQVHFAKSVLYLTAKDHANALSSARRAVEANPNYADGWANYAQVLVFSGEPEDSLEIMNTAMELNPRYAFFYTWIDGHARMLLGDHVAAETAFLNVLDRNPHFPGAHLTLASLYGNMDRVYDAEWSAQEILNLDPGFTISQEADRMPYQKPHHLETYLEGLRKAGLPE